MSAYKVSGLVSTLVDWLGFLSEVVRARSQGVKCGEGFFGQKEYLGSSRATGRK